MEASIGWYNGLMVRLLKTGDLYGSRSMQQLLTYSYADAPMTTHNAYAPDILTSLSRVMVLNDTLPIFTI